MINHIYKCQIIYTIVSREGSKLTEVTYSNLKDLVKFKGKFLKRVHPTQGLKIW